MTSGHAALNLPTCLPWFLNIIPILEIILNPSLLGAANLRDIGYHFSDTDPQYKGIDSKVLLSKVYDLIAAKGFYVVNIDCTVVLEKPKLNPYIPNMQTIIAKLIGVEEDSVSLKATTHEKVDSFGESRAIKAYASALLTKEN